MLYDLMTRLKRVEDRMVKHRIGVVTDTDPLSVALGGASEPHTDVKCLDGGPIATGDTVSCLTWGRDLLVLGRIVAAPAKRIVTGIVDSNGTESGGDTDQFSVTHPATGRYLLTFAPAFAATPTILPVGRVYPHAAVWNSAAASAEIRTYDTSHTLADAGIHFSAIGPA